MMKKPFAKVAGKFLLATSFLFFSTTVQSAGLQGLFTSPFGVLELKEGAGGSISGRLKKKDQCGRKSGTIVFSGSQLDDSITGSLKACFKGAANCNTVEVNASVLLLISPGKDRLTGVAHLPPQPEGCQAVLNQEGVILKRLKKTKTKNKRTSKKPVVKKHLQGPSNRKVTQNKIGQPSGAMVQAAENKNRLQSALSFIAQGKAEAARALFVEVIETKQQMDVAYNGLGVTFYLRERYEEAKKAYKKAMKSTQCILTLITIWHVFSPCSKIRNRLSDT